MVVQQTATSKLGLQLITQVAFGGAGEAVQVMKPDDEMRAKTRDPVVLERASFFKAAELVFLVFVLACFGRGTIILGTRLMISALVTLQRRMTQK